jgi:hypothetical protein
MIGIIDMIQELAGKSNSIVFRQYDTEFVQNYDLSLPDEYI